jgi:hypothetical protein
VILSASGLSWPSLPEHPGDSAARGATTLSAGQVIITAMSDIVFVASLVVVVASAFYLALAKTRKPEEKSKGKKSP